MAFAYNEIGDYMELTLDELESGIGLIKGFMEDLERTRFKDSIRTHPDFDKIYGILDNLRQLVEEYKRDLDEEYGHTHETKDWSPVL
jgi:hypothetical protein